jgi:hypothetical protein
MKKITSEVDPFLENVKIIRQNQIKTSKTVE